MKKLIVSICFLFIANLVLAQCPSNTFILFNTQEQIDEFGKNYPNCTYLQGLTIDGLNQVGEKSPQDLRPLRNVKTINNNLKIRNCPKLYDLFGLSGITRIGGILEIYRNDNFIMTYGIQNLVYVKSIRLYQNPMLRYINGFTRVGSLEYLEIFQNPSIRNFRGLRNLVKLSGLQIANCSRIFDLDDFERLTAIGKRISLSRNTNLQGCDIDAICNLLADPYAYVYVVNNGPDCTSRQVLEDECNSNLQSAVSGRSSVKIPMFLTYTRIRQKDQSI